MKRVRSFSARIEKYTDKSGSCWLWIRATNAKGYGICAEGLVHRASYKMYNGPVPEGKYVLHKCDVRNCCNPDHLYVGTQKDNVRDMYERNRSNTKGQPPGEKHSLAKLKDVQAIELLAKSKAGESIKDLAQQYGIGSTQVRRIVSGLRWKHLPR